MTDLEKLRDLLTGFGLEWEEESPYSQTGVRPGGAPIDVRGGTLLALESNEKTAGYGSFYADFIFDHEGLFVQAGFWE